MSFFFSDTRRNIDPHETAGDLKECIYDPDKSPLCPIIKLGTIVKLAGEDYNDLAYKVVISAVVLIVSAIKCFFLCLF